MPCNPCLPQLPMVARSVTGAVRERLAAIRRCGRVSGGDPRLAQPVQCAFQPRSALGPLGQSLGTAVPQTQFWTVAGLSVMLV